MSTQAGTNKLYRATGFGGLPTAAVLLACVGTVNAANQATPSSTASGQTASSVGTVTTHSTATTAALVNPAAPTATTTTTTTTTTSAPIDSTPTTVVDDSDDSEDETAENGVHVSDYMTVDIFVNNEDLANVLQMLSLQSKRNIVASSSVTGSVTANLYGVTFKEALDSILHANGFGYIEKGNFIYVYTRDEMDRITKAAANRVSKVIQLNYLNANDAAEFATPLLSDSGVIKTNGDVGDFSIPEDTPTGGEEFPHSATLVIYDFPDHLDQIEKLIQQLDTRPSQVLVEATILQTSLNEANAFGVDFAILADVNFTDFVDLGGPLGSALSLSQLGENTVAPADNRGASIVGTPGNFAGPATFKAGVILDDVAFFIRALDEVTDVKILSNPKILALNRQPARVLVGRKLGYLNTTSTETSTTQTVEFLDTGTQLSFRPFVSKDGMVRMELKPRVSEGVIRNATDATGAAVTIPDEITQEITTNVIVRDGQTIVLGGLFKETTTLSRSQVPILGDIPILGTAFRGHDNNTDRAEIMFMIKPTIVNDSLLAEQGERSMEYVERVRAGTRQGLLWFSRDRQTAQLNVEAERLAAEGKLDRAHWKLRRSLELNPHQPDALQLRERLFNEKDQWPTRSILDRVVNSEMEKTYSMDDRSSISPLLNSKQTASAPANTSHAKQLSEFDRARANSVSTASANNAVEVEGAEVIEDSYIPTEPSVAEVQDEPVSSNSNNSEQPYSPTSNEAENYAAWDQPIGFESSVQPQGETSVASNDDSAPSALKEMFDSFSPTDASNQFAQRSMFGNPDQDGFFRYPILAGLPWGLWWGPVSPVTTPTSSDNAISGVDATVEK